MESAIPTHLQCPRTRQRRIADDYQPFFPASVARYDTAVKSVVMAYFGVQYPASEEPALAALALRCIASAFAADKGPGHWDSARYVDEAGYVNVLSIGYWNDPSVYRDWFAVHGERWATGAFSDPRVGTFVEVLQPVVERFETLFSSNVPEGVGALTSNLSGAVQEHAYWGGVRDRLPIAQTDALAPVGAPRVVTDGLHRRVVPHENICLIRSGQDWTSTGSEERRMYVQDVEPVLRAGMEFLRDEGLPIGCFANRYMSVVDATGATVDKSFGMSWWKSLAALELWAESHPTHVAIFGAAMGYLGKLGPAAQLKLYHEVTVATAGQQSFDYFNCHPQTGMLRAALVPA